MRVISICVLSLLIFANPGYPIELGDRLPEGTPPTGEGLLIRSAQFSDSYEVDENGVKYVVTLDRKNKVNFIFPISKSFTTIDGIRVGSTYEEVLSATLLTMESMHGEPGWGHYIRLPSGWMAGFCVGGSCSGYPNLQDKVDLLFKRK